MNSRVNPDKININRILVKPSLENTQPRTMNDNYRVLFARHNLVNLQYLLNETREILKRQHGRCI